MKIKSAKWGIIVFVLLSMGATLSAKAQDKVKVTAGADLVSSYIWRGIDLGGVSIQPALELSYKGFSIGAWGAVGLDKEDNKELDFTIGYSVEGFSVAITDYWFAFYGETNKYFKYDSHATAHIYEGTLGYDFGALAVSWNTNFAGADYAKANGKRAYSTYVELNAPFTLGGIDFTAEVGFTPWEGAYSDKFNVTNIGLGAAKEIKITDSFALPTFAKLTFNPYTQGAYFSFGISF